MAYVASELRDLPISDLRAEFMRIHNILQQQRKRLTMTDSQAYKLLADRKVLVDEIKRRVNEKFETDPNAQCPELARLREIMQRLNKK